MLKCKQANEYKALEPPTCNNGRGCETCNQKWISISRAKARMRERFNTVRK